MLVTFSMKLIDSGDELICEDLATHDKIVTYIKMTVRTKVIIIVEIMFAESIITWKNTL